MHLPDRRCSPSQGVTEAQKLFCVAEVQVLMEGMGQDSFPPSHPSLQLKAERSTNGLCCRSCWSRRSRVPRAPSRSLTPGRGRAEQPASQAAGQETPSWKQIYVKALAGGMQFHTGAAGGNPVFSLALPPVHPVRAKFVAGCIGLFSWKMECPVMLRLLCKACEIWRSPVRRVNGLGTQWLAWQMPLCRVCW